MAKKKKSAKLNSMRVLEAQDVPYEVFTYAPEHHSALEVAQLAGVDPAIVFKTLVVKRTRGNPLRATISLSARTPWIESDVVVAGKSDPNSTLPWARYSHNNRMEL